jgi:hypothetical protein
MEEKAGGGEMKTGRTRSAVVGVAKGPGRRGAVQWGDVCSSMRSCEPCLHVCGAQHVVRQTGGRSAPCRVSGTIHGCTRRVNTTCGAVPSRTTDVASRTTDVASPHCRQLLLKNIGLRDPT